MESIKIENLSFTYPGRDSKALDNINITIYRGEFVTVCGKSGCGKTTLLRLLKPALAPAGSVDGSIYLGGEPLCRYDAKQQAEKIGIVMQNPDSQVVTDKVWHELAFGLESLGFTTPQIRARVAEMASFFGIEDWFYKNVSELSGGQKQLLNLASVMVMQPEVLILDEPTSQLDPIAAQEFLKTLEKVNRELGTTVILTEHRLEEVFTMSDRVIVLDEGGVVADDNPRRVGELLRQENSGMYAALPAPMRIYGAVEDGGEAPLTVREGREWLEEFSAENELNADLIPTDKKTNAKETAIEIKDVWFRYEKDLSDVVKGLNIKIGRGEIFALVGGNGAGKTTILSLLCGLNKPYRGEILIGGKRLSEIPDLYSCIIGYLPQNPQGLFVKKTVFQDLLDVLSNEKLSETENMERIAQIEALCHIEALLERHPYDLSGGEMQRAALAKVLLKKPEILLLDEPTKGMDAQFKEEFAEILKSLTTAGVTVVMVSHDIEFCARYTDRCALVFDGSIASSGAPREFFSGQCFYTTSVSRMARTKLPGAVLSEDVILACGKSVPEREKLLPEISVASAEKKPQDKKVEKKKLTPKRAIMGAVFVLLFVLTNISFMTDNDILGLTKVPWLDTNKLQILTIIEIAIAAVCFFPQQKAGTKPERQIKRGQKPTKRSLLAMLFVLVAVPLTVYAGVRFFGDRRYYFISLMIIFETMIPFFALFEGRKPQAREVVLVSTLCAISVAGRAAFFMLPQFKPTIALIVITGVCFGGETGFLVGAVTGFISNFFFGQGPWTPWQMFALGMVGFLAGIMFKNRKSANKLILSVFGFLVTLVVYGSIMNSSFIIQSQPAPTLEMIVAACISGLPFDLVYAVSTAFFLWFISDVMTDKLERIKVKYGLM